MYWFLIYYIGVFLLLFVSFLTILWYEKRFTSTDLSFLPSSTTTNAASQRFAVASNAQIPPTPTPPPSYKKFAPPDYDESMSKNIKIFCITETHKKISKKDTESK